MVLRFLATLLLCVTFSVSAAEEKKILLMNNIGALYHPVSTKDPKAQQYFNQGLTFIFCFNHDFAFESFKAASEIDPNLAMAYWGEALALGPNINSPMTKSKGSNAYDLIQKALSLSKNATPNEQEYIQALSKRYSNDPQAERGKLDLAYKNAMEEVVENYPDDLDAQTLYAESVMDLTPWRLWTPDGNFMPGAEVIVSTLESVLKRDPYHIGANHYYIHAVEGSKHPEYALPSAGRLSSLVPASGHIQHMPSHIYILCGFYHEAVLVNEKAIKEDRKYIDIYGDHGYPLHYMTHNFYFLSRAYSLEGNFKNALSAANQIEEFYGPHFEQMKDLEYYMTTKMFTYLRFNKWDEMLQLPKPKPEMKVATLLWHFARAYAFASLKQLPEAAKEQQIFLSTQKDIATSEVFGYNLASKIVNIAANVLNARISNSKDDLESTITYLENAISVQDTLGYNEPPDWFYSVRESLGAVLCRAKRYADSEAVFRKDLELHPRNGRSLFGLQYILEAQNRLTDLFWVKREFETAWQYADITLTIEDL